MKLKKCKCGNKASQYPDIKKGDNYDELRMIYCDKCDLSTLSWATWNDARLDWNEIIINNELKSKKE